MTAISITQLPNNNDGVSNDVLYNNRAGDCQGLKACRLLVAVYTFIGEATMVA